ncbi:MAG: phosphoribosylformylglycinamidine synthase subunit PurS [Crenarchaeota archaeon]|nr:phosphoribosylformylglycinamidine synthase subunit PurS [Thermoproteota archaeon]
MRYIVRVEIRLRKDLHDPEGAVALSCLQDLGLRQIRSVRSGKVYYLEVETNSKEEAFKIADEACRRLLANPVKDEYSIEIVSET